jgi:hypothetical protein
MGLMDFENEDWNTFQDVWGSVKFYEEFRTITGKECNTLTKTERSGLQFFEQPFSERHFLSDYFSKAGIPGLILQQPQSPFITRWTHGTSRQEITELASGNETSLFSVIERVFSPNELANMPESP